MGAVNDPADAGAGGLLRIRTFGDVSLEYVADGAVQGSLGVGKPVALVAYLACSPRRAESRDHLVDLLWSDVDAEAARHSLRQSVWYLKRRLGAPILSSDADRVTLLPAISFDRDELLSAVQRVELNTVDKLYRGDFFAGFATPGGAEFEHWADGERQRLRSAWMRCLEGLVSSHVSAGRFRDAQATARRLRDADPLRQASWRLLIETLLAGRDQLGATLEADALAALLAREEHEADPNTRRVLRSITQSAAQSAPTADVGIGTVATDLIGREREFAELLSHWEATRVGSTRVTALVGGAGIGKSRLLLDLASRLRAARARVVQVRATAAATDIGYSFAGDVVGALSQLPGAIAVPEAVAGTLLAINPAVASMFPRASADSATGDDAMRRRVVALRELLAAVSEEQPVALLLDDLHWSDASTRRLLAAALAGLSTARVFVVVTSRVSVREFSALDAAVVRVEPLEADDVVTMLASIAHLPNEPWGDALVADLHRASEGVPLLLLETIQLALERGALTVTEGNWHRRDVSELQSLLHGDSAIVRRIASVDESDRPLLLLLAIAAVPLSIETIASALADLDSAESRLRGLEDRGLVVREDARWRIVHDEYGALLQRNASADEVRAMHAAVGRVELRAAADEHAEARAIAHLVVAGEIAALGGVLARRVDHARRMRDVRSTKFIAREMVGDDAPDDLVRTLTRRVPVLVRAGVVTRSRAASLLGLCALSIFAVSKALSARPEPPAAVDELPMLAVARPVNSVDSVPVYSAPLPSPSDSLNLSPDRIASLTHLEFRAFSGASATRGGWLISRLSSDAGRIDIYEHRLNDGERRLTNDPADDNGPSVSPDGHSMVFSTGRFDHETDHDEVSVLELSTRTMRRLTNHRSIDNGARWSLDGARIAFMSNDFSRPGNSICVINSDGSAERCHAFEKLYRLVGWLSASRLLVQSAERGRLKFVDVDTWQDRDSDLDATTAILSPDGRWLLCRCQVGGYHETEWWVAPIDDLSKKRLARVPGADPSAVELNWMPGAAAPRYLYTLEVERPKQGVSAGTSFSMTYRAHDVRGHSLVGVPLSWATEDSAVAIIDSLGVLRAIKPGRTRVTVTAGGWRSASTVVDVVEARPSAVVMTETWDARWTERWIPFGSPSPRVDLVRDASWFFPNGDGRFASGAITREPLAIQNGLEIEATVMIPVKHPQWQQLGIAFTGYRPPKRLADVIKAMGDDTPASLSDAGCSFNYPGSAEGYGYADTFSLAMRNPAMLLSHAAAPALQRGEPTMLRLRLLADGRCEVRIGDRLLSSPPSARLDNSLQYHIEITGQSAWDPNAISGIVVRRSAQ